MSIILPASRDDGRFKGKKVAVITAGPTDGAQGGAERFYIGLREGFESIGCSVEMVAVPASEPSVDQIISNYHSAVNVNLSRFDIVVSSKAPTYAVRHPHHVMFLNHAVRIFDDMFEDRFAINDEQAFRDRFAIHKQDFDALLGVKARMSQGFEITRRLMRWRGLSSQVLHPPLGFNQFHPGDETGDYLFIAGRLHRWKRIGLLIEAVKASSCPLQLLIAGDGEDGEALREQAAGDPRIEFLGRVDDEQLVELYSRAIAIPFLPVREDYGYVTLEAFASGKPILTCTDSGEPAQIVRNYRTGLVVAPDPKAIAEAMEWFWNNRQQAAEMGRRGREQVDAMSWPDTAYALACAATDGLSEKPEAKRRVTVLDMQPIDPPTGGGRLRLLGLYHQLGRGILCNYVGTYDWPGEKHRAHWLSSSLFETDVPLSDAHHAAAADLARRAAGKNVIDVAFSRQAHLSPDFVAAACKAAEEAEVVIFSHPWVYPLVKHCLRPNQVVIYESHNVEGFLRAQLLDDANPVEREVLENLVSDELEVGKRADWILACSQEDLLRFNRLFGFSPAKMRVVPNGVMAFRDPIPTPDSRRTAKDALGLPKDGFVAIFIGSGYGPNLDAARFINDSLAGACPDVTFVIAGGVGQDMSPARSNVIITGLISDMVRDRWYHAADIAVNPMLAGSGTNIKMFDFMAMALPVISTEIGARGIETGGVRTMTIVPPDADAFAAAIEQLRDQGMRNAMGAAARGCVEDDYAWERISDRLGAFIAMREKIAGQTLPKFSVVIPSYERHDKLAELVSALQLQVERDFEVVIVDQSTQRWADADEPFGFPLTYYHSPVKGAVRARNTGAMLAQGEIIAFIDDDCLPEPEWLLSARRHFADETVVGLEGLIYSDRQDDADWRPVTNVGFEGIGFMTANLMVRSAAFQYLGGFDLQFDRPHFREDTDFGWRLQELGRVPYCHDVKVFHPAQSRAAERESVAERTKFFRKDALLWRKHPERYRELFLREGHFLNSPGFANALLEGFLELGLHVNDLPEWMRAKIEGTVRA